MRAVENALKIEIPDNARLMRNIIHGIQYVQDHVIHFYHLHALDWVDLVSALQADPAKTSDLAQSISDWPLSSAAYFKGVQDKLNTFVQSGQLGLFANGYWGHPAYKLPPEANLMAVSHYLQALQWQREVIKIQAILGSKNPHPQTYLVGGMSLPLDANREHTLNASRIQEMKQYAQQALEFVQKVYIPDLLAVAGFYKDWAGYGAGVGNMLAYGDFPQDTSGNPAALWLPQGVITGKNIAAAQAFDVGGIQEFVTHSWYKYPEGDQAGKHPSQGDTTPNYSGPQPPYDLLNTDGKYSWVKAPRYSGAPMEVGPLARMLVANAAGHQAVQAAVKLVLDTLGVGPEVLLSTLGRTAARGVETLVVAQELPGWIDALAGNIGRGIVQAANTTRWNPSSWPDEAEGYGQVEAPRGALGHWVRIKGGKIDHYQCIVPSTWNGCPRDERGQRGPWEEALIDTPVANPEQPLEILRTVHSFDPCMACAVHVVDKRGRPIMQVQISE